MLPLPITISDRALEEVKHIMAHKNIPAGYALRIGVRGGGCTGMGFMLGFDTPKSADDVYEHQGIGVLIEKRHAMYLLGVTLDFEETAEARGFLFLTEAELAARQA